MARFCPLYSSSSGNCTYVGGGSGGILIDAGVSAKRMEQGLKDIDVDPKDIGAIFITHEHSDHIKGLRVFAGRHKIPVFASQGTLDGLEDMGELDGKFDTFAINGANVEICNMEISAFSTSHDSNESVGYRIKTADDRVISVATDMGLVTPETFEGLMGCDLVMLESNHDINMLMCGPYPYIVKRRVLSDYGHLSNEACAHTALTLLESGTTRFVLAHLSRQNNLPELALETTRGLFTKHGATEGADYLLQVAGDLPANKVSVL
ncbi:MAG TPA: MBL fold metallo-hydrolase [Clostridiales bacterium]|nr:MBL fold metallo-hydrolase [Clostridiales bacterium]